jgi:hypothetical protein
MKTIFLPDAETEMHDAAQYYAHESKGLGDRFYEVMALTVSAIESYPKAAPVIRAGFRRRLLSVFPYAIYISPSITRKLSWWRSATCTANPSTGFRDLKEIEQLQDVFQTMPSSLFIY